MGWRTLLNGMMFSGGTSDMCVPPPYLPTVPVSFSLHCCKNEGLTDEGNDRVSNSKKLSRFD